MAITVEAGGRHYKDVLQTVSRDRANPMVSAIYILPHRLRHADFLFDRINFALGENPELNRNSVLVLDAVDNNRHPMDALSTPFALLEFIPAHRENLGLPKAGETFIISAVHVSEATTKQYIIADRPEAANAFASRNIIDELYWRKGEFTITTTELVRPKQFMAALRQEIDEGRNVSPFLMRFNGLYEYYRMRKREARERSISSR